MAELVDALDLGSSGAIRGGSSPPFRTLIEASLLRAETYRAKRREHAPGRHELERFAHYSDRKLDDLGDRPTVTTLQIMTAL